MSFVSTLHRHRPTRKAAPRDLVATSHHAHLRRRRRERGPGKAFHQCSHAVDLEFDATSSDDVRTELRIMGVRFDG